MSEDEQNNTNNIEKEAVSPEQQGADAGIDITDEPQTSGTAEASSLQGDASAVDDAQPVATPTETVVTPVNEAPVADASGKKKNKTLMWCLIGAAVAVVAIAVVLVLVFTLGKNGGGQASVDKVKQYCTDNGYSVSTEHDDEHNLDVLACIASDTGAGVTEIVYAVADKPIVEIDGFDDEELDSSLSALGGSVLVNNNGYKKIYMTVLGQATYMILSGNSYIMVSGTNDSVKNTLIALGYPDDVWGDASQSSSSWEDWLDDMSDESDTVSDMEQAQRDAQRKLDIAGVISALTIYQTNNSGRLPEGPSYWEGTETIDCTGAGVACVLVREYLNMGDDKNTFVDPSGKPYNVYITENWVTNDSITSESENMFSYLEEDGEGYTIDGFLPFDEHVVFIVPGGKCGSDSNVIKAQSTNNIAVMYLLEDDSIYCADNM